MKGVDNMQKLEKMLACKEETKKLRFPLDIQHFAESPEPQDLPTDPPVDPPADPPTPPALTQKDIDDAIAAAKIKWDDEQLQQQTEAQKLAKMTKEQREEYEKKQKEDTLSKREEELNKRELISTAKETLAEKSLPLALADALDYTNADTCNASIDKIGKVFEDAVQQVVLDKLKGTDPLKLSKLSNPTTTLTREQVAAMSPAEINANWDEIQEMMKKGQL